MVPLPLFKLAALFLRHVSKYGANRIKIQAHDHPKFRTIAAKYGQTIHQITMRVSVASMRDLAAEKRAKEKAEAPTVKTEEEVKAEAEKAEKAEKAAKAGATIITPKPGITITKEPKRITHEAGKSVWTRTFRPLPEAKAVDLFADVIGDTFILLVAGGLITYEYIKAKQKPDQVAERLDELTEQLKGEERRIAELEESEKEHKQRVQDLEQALELLRNEKAPGRMKRALSMS